MTNSAKLSLSFSVAAAFLLAVGTGAVLLIDHVNSILDDIGFYNLQIDQVADAITALRVHPERQEPNLARIDDLQKWARTDFERTRIVNASAEFERPTSSGDAIGELERLSAYYRDTAGKAHERLMVIHQRAIQGAIILMSGGVLLLVVIMMLVRRWFLGPLFNAAEAIHLTLCAQHLGFILAIVRGEFTSCRQLRLRALIHKAAHDVEVRHVLTRGIFRGRAGH